MKDINKTFDEDHSGDTKNKPDYKKPASETGPGKTKEAGEKLGTADGADHVKGGGVMNPPATGEAGPLKP